MPTLSLVFSGSAIHLLDVQPAKAGFALVVAHLLARRPTSGDSLRANNGNEAMHIKLLFASSVTAMSMGVAAADVLTANQRAKSGDFDDAGTVRCAQEVGQSLGTCTAEVARAEDAVAVVVRFPNGFARTLSFADGGFLRGNATMSGVGTDTEWQLSDDIFEIRVDDQRFEIPEALVFGD